MPDGVQKKVQKFQAPVYSTTPTKIQMGYSRSGFDRDSSIDGGDISSLDPLAARVEHSGFDLPEYDDADIGGDYGSRDD